MSKLACFKNVKATLPCKKYFNYHHELDSGLKTKIQQLYWLKDLDHWLIFSLTVGQGVFSGLHTRILTEREQMGVNTVILNESCLHIWILKHSTPKRILIQHVQYFRFWQEMNLCAIANHQSSWFSAQISYPSAGLTWVLLLDLNNLLSTPNRSLRGQGMGLLLQDCHLQAVKQIQIAEIHQGLYCSFTC